MIEAKTNDKTQTTTPRWLKNIQNNSWEPEIILSGLTITFIFVMNNYIHNFFALLVQEYNAVISSMFFYVFFIVALNIVKIVLILHLLLRGLWTGLVGLSYVYPQGVQSEKLPSLIKEVSFDKPIVLILKIEDICSHLFSFIFFFIILVFLFSALYMPLVIIEYLSVDNLVLNFYAYLGVILIFLILIISIKKLRLKFSNNFINNLAYTFSTNVGNFKSLILMILSLLISTALSWTQIKNFRYENFLPDNKLSNQITFYLDNEDYISERDNELRVKKATIQDFHVVDDLEVFISWYKGDEITLTKANELTNEFKLLIDSAQSTSSNINTLFRFYIDSVEIKDAVFINALNSDNQKGILVQFNQKIEPGLHNLTINKIVWIPIINKFKIVSPWDEILFYKD